MLVASTQLTWLVPQKFCCPNQNLVGQQKNYVGWIASKRFVILTKHFLNEVSDSVGLNLELTHGSKELKRIRN